jgi:hypothetical protein
LEKENVIVRCYIWGKEIFKRWAQLRWTGTSEGWKTGRERKVELESSTIEQCFKSSR